VSTDRRGEPVVEPAIYRPAWWVRGGHAQTLWGKFFRPKLDIPTQRERWETPDGDFVDLYRLAGLPGAPRLLFLHGLEGTIRSHYIAGYFNEAKRRGWAADLMIFRSCSDEMNHTPRFYHSGDTNDLEFVLDRIIAETPEGPIVVAGVSLGGNVLLKFLGERANSLPARVRGAAVVSVPYDLEAGCRYIMRGGAKIYDRHFMKSLRRKALEKLEQYPDLFDRRRLDAARTIYEFDDAVTAPVHGFADAHDYYSQSSALGFLSRITLPTFLLSAFDDPFLPPAILDRVREIARDNPHLQLEFTEHGGHVGFVYGKFPGAARYYAEWRVCQFLSSVITSQP
jgi:predicted alpha/beta-fold hydrolase